jgi:hypothetical protein
LCFRSDVSSLPLFGTVRVTLAQLIDAQGQMLDYRIEDENGHFIGDCLLTLAPLLVTVEVSEASTAVPQERITTAFFAAPSALKAIFPSAVIDLKVRKSSQFRVRLKICTGCEALVHPRYGAAQILPLAANAPMQVLMPTDHISPMLGLFSLDGGEAKLSYLDQTESQHVEPNPIFRKAFVLDTFLDQPLVDNNFNKNENNNNKSNIYNNDNKSLS